MIKGINPSKKTNVFGDTLARGWAESKRTPRPHLSLRRASAVGSGGSAGEEQAALHKTLQATPPMHSRPVSRIRPSGHSQRKEPAVLMQRPLGQTPGKTSHSFTSREQRARRRPELEAPRELAP